MIYWEKDGVQLSADTRTISPVVEPIRRKVPSFTWICYWFDDSRPKRSPPIRSSLIKARKCKYCSATSTHLLMRNSERIDVSWSGGKNRPAGATIGLWLKISLPKTKLYSVSTCLLDLVDSKRWGTHAILATLGYYGWGCLNFLLNFLIICSNPLLRICCCWLILNLSLQHA